MYVCGERNREWRLADRNSVTSLVLVAGSGFLLNVAIETRITKRIVQCPVYRNMCTGKDSKRTLHK